MKKIKWYKNNRGSSLLFVIISIAFVAILGTLLSQLTNINLQMKSIDRKAKTTFYTTETALNELQIALEDISGDAMKKAYTDIVQDYANITNDADQSLQAQFAYEYVKNLVNTLYNGTVIADVSDASEYKIAAKDFETTYSPNIIKSKMDAIYDKNQETTGYSPSEWFVNQDTITDNALKVVLDNSSGGESYVILKNITVSYNTEKDKSKNDPTAVAHEATITTDIKLKVPTLTFQSGIYPKYTSYSIISNKNLITSADFVKIDGDLYGSSGILVKGGDASFTGPKTTNIVTRGDFLVYQGAEANIKGENKTSTTAANDCVKVWANNFGTEKETVGATSDTILNFTGDAFIQDDLIVNANSSIITMRGNNYYGFGYNKMNKSYTAMSTREKKKYMNSQYSSAITINGKNVSLDMGDMLNVMLAGRAYVSRVQERTSMLSDGTTSYTDSYDDIMSGESVSIKGNQTAYLLPGDAITGGMNPMPAGTYQTLNEKGEEIVDTGKLSSVKKYLNIGKMYTTYFYNIKNAGSYVYFYYNFKNQEMANEYFADYYNTQKSALEAKLKSSAYINNSGAGVSLNIEYLAASCVGNILAVTKDGKIDLQKPSVDPDGDLSDILDIAVKKAKEYYSMQLELSTESGKYPIAGTAAEGVDFRIPGNSNEEKSEYKSIYSEVVSGASAFESEGAAGEAYGFENYSASGHVFKVKKVDMSAVAANAAVYCIYDSDEDSEITITPDFLKVNGSFAQNGIILASCKVNMAADFNGMIISKSDMTLKTNNVTLSADTQLVQEILTYGQQCVSDSKTDFAHYFGLTKNGTATDPTAVDISSYVSYSNWRKN